MTVINPPGFLQNAGATHTAELTRNAFLGHSAGRLSVGSLKPRGGVMRDLGSALAVVQAGSPNMTVDVGSGAAYIPGTEGTTQGIYSFVNNGTVNLAIAAAHATLARIDIVVAKVEDQVYSGAANTASLAVVTGTPSGSPAAPAAPNNSLTLGQVSVPAADTTITNSQITDKRLFLTAPGGIIPCLSTVRPDTATVLVGQVIWETDTELLRLWDGIGWPLIPYVIQENTLGSDTASVTFSNIPSSLKKIRLTWCARSSTSGVQEIQLTVNGTAGANYFGQFIGSVGTGSPASTVGNATAYARVGAIPGSNAGANIFGVGHCEFVGWDKTTTGNLTWTSQSGFYDTSASCFNEVGQWRFAPAGPYSSLTLDTPGNFVTGSRFVLEAMA